MPTARPSSAPRWLALAALLAAAACAREQERRELAAAPRAIGMCASCHGPLGRSPQRGTPHLAAQDEDYLVASMLQYRNGQRPHAAMRAVMGALSEAEIRELARFYATRPACAGEGGG
ncbi:MAG: cytochrome C [Xanthomonadales bacterium]|nr:cytochrome C [Xanthomonadales bacterium]